MIFFEMLNQHTSHDITNEDSTRARGALTALSMNKDDLMVFIFEGAATRVFYSPRGSRVAKRPDPEQIRVVSAWTWPWSRKG